MVHKIILDLCELVLAESLKEEVIATIRNDLEYKYDNEETETYIDDFLMRNYDDVPK